MPPRPFFCASRCFCRLRHLRTASSSRQNCSETNLPGVVMLSKRSSEMKPSARSRSALSSPTSRRYSGNCPGAGVNSKITAIIAALPAQNISVHLDLVVARQLAELVGFELHEAPEFARRAGDDVEAALGQQAAGPGRLQGVGHLPVDLHRHVLRQAGGSDQPEPGDLLEAGKSLAERRQLRQLRQPLLAAGGE